MWLTPSELFTPFYSNILANFVYRSMNDSLQNSDADTFDIVELGGGRGTNANALLDYLKANRRDMYERLDRYTIFDTSPTLHDLQREVLLKNSLGEYGTHADKINLRNVDLMDIAEGVSLFLSPSSKPTAVIALELLDNLPHDKVARCIQSSEILQAKIKDTNQALSSQQPPNSEIFCPLSDELLKDIFAVAAGVYEPKLSHGPRWVPSVALGILLKLYQCRPNTSIAFADFDWLPPPDSHEPALAEATVGDPLVTDMNGKDYACHLSPPSDALCDILFPTDFQRLQAFVKEIHTNMAAGDTFSVSAMKQHTFLLKHGRTEVEQTKSWLTGYSPLIHDFGNCSVLEVAPRSLKSK